MADHTELVLGVRVRDEPDAVANLQWMVGDAPHAERERPPAQDGHKLWTLPSARWMLRGGGLSTGGRAPLLREVPGEDAREWELMVWTSFVDREAQSAAFLDWLGSRVSADAHRREQAVGWLMWQGASERIPDLIFYDPGTGRIQVSAVARVRGLRF